MSDTFNLYVLFICQMVIIIALGEVSCDTTFTLLENTRVQQIVVYEKYLVAILYEESWIAMLKLALKLQRRRYHPRSPRLTYLRTMAV